MPPWPSRLICDPFLASLGMTDVQQHLLGIDVGDAEMAGLVNPQPGGVAGHEQTTVLRTPDRLVQRHQLLGMQHHRYVPVPSFGKRNVLDFPGTLQRDGVQELEGGVDLPIGRIGQVFDFDLMEQELPDLGFA
jgi:hypothetical protein